MVILAFRLRTISRIKMIKKTTYNGTIDLTVEEESGKEPKAKIAINFDDVGEDSYLLIPALYDLLKDLHTRYSLINSFRKK